MTGQALYERTRRSSYLDEPARISRQRQEFRDGVRTPLAKKFARATTGAGHWTLPDNDFWSIPEEDQRMEVETSPHGWGAIRKIRGVAIDEQGFIYGMRTLSSARESGYQMEGRVSVGGKFYRAFTSSKLFQRDNGDLVNVGVLFVCRPDTDDKFWHY